MLIKQKYCAKCGRKLKKVIVPAEKVTRFVFHNSYHPFDRFNQSTGERQYATYYKCPVKFGIFHDDTEQRAELV